MLTRRQLLTTIAAAPLARFCKTEPGRFQPKTPQLDLVPVHVFMACALAKRDLPVYINRQWETFAQRRHVEMICDEAPNSITCDAPYFTYTWSAKETVERRYNLPQGTLG